MVSGEGLSMRVKIKLLIASGLMLASAVFLTGCGHKNPLLNEDTISFMKENFMFESPDFPIKECADYYSNQVGSSTLKSKCNQWTQSYYRILINSGSIPAMVTVDDLRDVDFWKQVKPIK